MLKLKLFFAVCKDICIPSDADAALLLNGEGADAAAISAAEGLVPAPGTAIASVTAIDTGGGVELHVAFVTPPQGQFDVFVEGAEPAYVRAPQFRDGGCVLPVAGLKAAAGMRGKSLRFTLVGKNMRLEQIVVVA